MATAIKSCPFCGGEGKMYSHPHGYNDGDLSDKDYYIKCRSCAAEGPWARHDENAITLWNMRHEPGK